VALGQDKARTGVARATLRILPALVVVAATLAAFQPALSAGFVSYDDPENLVTNTAFRGLSGSQLAWMLRTGWMGHYQPLSWISLALDFLRGGAGEVGGLDPRTFHATNVALHAAAALAVMVLARRILTLGGVADPARAMLGACLAALVFAVHPLRVESVAWVTERRDVLSTPLLVLSVVAWLRWGRTVRASDLDLRRLAVAGVLAFVALALFVLSVDRGRPGILRWGPAGAGGLALALVSWGGSVVLLARAAPGGARLALGASLALLLLSLGAKAWGIVTPALLLVLDAWPLRRGSGTASPVEAWGRLLLEKAPIAAPCAAFALLATWAQASQAGTMRSLAEHGLGERLAQALYGLAWYPARTLVPAGLAPIYDLPAELSLAQPRFLVPALAVAAVTALLVAWRRRLPALLAAWIAYAVTVSPVLGLTQSGPQLVADRYAYLAGIPFAVLAGGALAVALRLRPRLAPAWIGLSVLAVALLAAGTRAQARVWHDSETLWTHALESQPTSPMAHLGLGYLRLEQALSEPDPGRRREALERTRALLERGLELEELPRLLSNLSLVEGALADLEPARADAHRARALELSERALALARERGGIEAQLQLTHAVHLVRADRLFDALPWFEAFTRDRPRDAQGHLRYGAALLAAERLGEARREAERAVELDPQSAPARELLRAVEQAQAAGRR
jgi:tetratricopeptide (TPR) repeat protein